MVNNKTIGKQSGKQSVYSNNIGGPDQLNSLCVRLNVTVNSLGLMAAPFIIVTGISREKLPLYKCLLSVYIICIPGFCAGSSVGPGYIAPGYVAFVRGEKSSNTQTSSKQRNFEWYRTNILLPFIEICCTKYYG